GVAGLHRGRVRAARLALRRAAAEALCAPRRPGGGGQAGVRPRAGERARLEAEERLKGAQARLENLQAGRRAPEVEALREEVAQAKAALGLSASQLAQQEKLFKGGFVSQA